MLDKLNKQKKLEKAKQLFLDSLQSDYAWNKEATEDFAFHSGVGQWTAEERQILEDNMRPVLTFNLIKSSIDLILGLHEDTKIRFKCAPVDPSDGFLCEILNDVVDWIYDAEDFEDEEATSLESASICGRGFAAVDFNADPNRFGEIKMTMVNVPVHEVHYDPASRRPNLEDASYICWDRWLSKEDFKMKFPKIPASKIDDLIESGRSISFPSGTGMPSDVFDMESGLESDELSDYSHPLDLNFYDRAKNMVRVVHMEYWQTYKRYYAFDLETGSWVEFDGKDLKQNKEKHLETYGKDLEYETITDKKVKWLQFIGDDILYDDDSPLPYTGFSIVPMFAYRDASRRTRNDYGVVRLMKDPQKEVNKRWSQALNLLNTQTQPGVYAETEAFVDQRQAELSMKDPGAITWVNSGAIAGGKIKERTVPVFPSAPMQMEQFSQDILRKITGINPDLLGQDRGRQEPGVVVRMRQQQGITLLKPLFKSLNRMKKELFKRQLAIITMYMPDEQFLRILGQGERYTVDPYTGILTDNVSGAQANIRDIRNLEYNIKADSAPGSMTSRMLELSAYMEMMQAGLPVDPKIIIDKTDLPASDKLRWLEYINSQQQAQQEYDEKARAEEQAQKDKELAIEREDNILNYKAEMAKVAQRNERDDKKLIVSAKKAQRDDMVALTKAELDKKELSLEIIDKLMPYIEKMVDRGI